MPGTLYAYARDETFLALAIGAAESVIDENIERGEKGVVYAICRPSSTKIERVDEMSDREKRVRGQRERGKRKINSLGAECEHPNISSTKRCPRCQTTE